MMLVTLEDPCCGSTLSVETALADDDSVMLTVNDDPHDAIAHFTLSVERAAELGRHLLAWAHRREVKVSL